MKLNKLDTSGKTSSLNKNNQLHFPFCHMARHAERFFPPGFLMSFEKPELKGTEQGLQPSPCHYINFPSVQLLHQNCFRTDSTDLNCENKRTLILHCDFCPGELVLKLLWGSIITSVQCKKNLCIFVSFVGISPPPFCCHP